MKIREYNNTTDKEAVIKLLALVFSNESPHNDPQVSVERKVKQNDSLFFVAEADDKEIAGTVMAGYDGHRGWIYSLGVLPRFRKAGTGTMLLKHAENELKKLNCPKINLQILAPNKEVVSFYEKSGFKVEERISMGKIL